MRKIISKLFFTLLVLTMGIGQMWAADITVTPTIGQNVNTLPYGLFTITHSSTKGDSKISSGAIAANTKNDVITINFKTTKSDMYIKSVTFNTLSNGTLSSDDGTISSNTFTVSGNENDVNVVLTSNSNAKGSVKITNVVVNTGTNTVETITFDSFDGTAKTFGFTSSAGASSSLTSISSNNSNSVSSNILSWSNSRTLVFTASGKIKYAAFVVNDGKAYTGFTADAGTYADNYSWTGDVETLTLSNGTGGGRSIKNFYLIIAPAPKHTVTYDLNGGGGTTPTQADVAEGSTFTVASGTTGITAPTSKKFFKWYDGTNYYAAGDTYTMGTSDVTLTAQWVDDLPDPTVTFTDATYILGASALNMADNFSSNSSGAVTYALKEATTDASITSAGVFTATAEGTYVVVASQEAVAGTFAAIDKEATVTVLDNELSDTYVWKKNASYTGCVANPNADAPAAQYTDIAYEGFTGMGRAAADNTECILTFTVKAAYSATFGIKSICTYGKFEEPAGGQISWDGGANWEDLAAYTTEQAKTFNAPATFPTSFKIKFLGVNKGSGGLWWRNALVTLEVKKTVSGITEALQNVKVNDAAISASDLTSLQTNKTLNIATTYAAAPTVTFVKRTTTNYLGGWPASVVDTEEDVVASDATTNWSATSSAINAQTYTVTLAKPAGPTLETTATSFTLTSAKIATAQEQFTFSGANLSGNVTISLESAVTGMTVSPTEVTPTAGAITDQEVTITYKSLDDVATANVNLIVYYDADTKITIPLTYSSTAGVEDLTPISAATTWNWDGAADAAFGTLGQNDMIVLVNADVTWNASFNASAIAGKLQHYYRESKYAQGNELKFNTTIPGKVYVTYSNTGGNPARTVNVNGTKGSLTTAGTGEKRTESFLVSAGDVLIKGVLVSDDSNQMLRFYEVRFAPVYSVTYDAGEGSVKGGEVIPTQADEAAGEKITLASADALEKSGYDFTGWLCNVDGVTYNAGVEYTMTAAATTFTAQWAVHVDPVDPTLTYDEGAYTTGGAALDLSSLITAQTSTGAITYSVKTDGGTGAAIDGNNFTATAAGTATITASQAAVLGYNAITVDFNVVVTEATEIDGIKMVVAGDLTGNFRIKADQLKSGSYTVEGISYTKYVQMGSTHTSFSGETEGNQTKGIYYAPAKKNIKFWFYMRNTDSSARKIYIYKMEEGSALSSETVDVPVGSQLVSYDMTLATNAEVVFGVENTKLYFCQIVAVESGDNLLQAGENGYVFDYSKKRQNVAANTLRTIDGMQYYLSAESKINSAANVQLQTLGTHYLKFHLDAPKTVKVTIDGTGKQYYVGTECSEGDDAKLYSATETHEFDLAAGDWYINAGGVQLKITKIEFVAPKCAEPAFNALANSEICDGDAYVALDGTATVADAGVPTYQWYNADGDEAIDGATAAEFTPTADGSYYVIATNHLADHSDNAKQSATVTVTTFASAQITTAPVDVRQKVGEDATLTVVASGKAPISYQWYTCDENGDNTAIIAGAENASYTVNVTANLDQYYKVVVSSGCGEASAVARIVEWVALPQLSVSTTTTWDWTNISNQNITLTDQTVPAKNEECVLANVKVGDKMPTNDETFNSQALLFYGEHVRNVESGRAYASIGHIKFTTTVAGKVTVEFSDNGTNNRKLKINDALSESSASKTDVKTFSAVVPAGEVTLMGVKNDGTGNNQYIRISKIIFSTTDVDGADYTRNVTEGRYGTICLPNGGVMTGAELYEVAYKDPSQNKIFFAQIPSGEMIAGRPYIFLPKEGATQLGVFYTDAANASAGNYHGLYGFIGADASAEFTIPAGEGNYIIQNNQYREVETGGVAKIVSNRAYLKYSEIPGTYTPKPGIKLVSIGAGAPQTPTGCENLDASEAPVKVMINGQMFILRGEKMYDAQGRLVK